MTQSTAGTATPYPAELAVSGLSHPIADLNVSLRGIYHTWPDDIAVLLVGPEGQKVILMSDVGSGADLNNVDLTFDDETAGSLPDHAQITSGTYRPTQGTSTYDDRNSRPANFPSPAPAGPYGTALSDFDGANPNDTYKLFVLDDVSSEDKGRIAGGFSLDITENLPPTITNMTPKPASKIRDTTPLIKAVVKDDFGQLALEGTKMFVDGKLRPAFYDPATQKLVRQSNKLSFGKHTVMIEATDAQGSKTTKRWSFKVVRR